MSEQTRRRSRSRAGIYWLSRSLVCLVVAGALGTLFWQPSGAVLWAVDALARAYVMFLGCVMAHEAAHGHMGSSRAANFWWGRLSLLPVMVPYTNFRKTHHLHHAHTNVPERDPDYFMRPRRAIEIPWRAVAMAHQWFFWLWSRGRLSRSDLLELALNYAGILAVYAVILSLVGPMRLCWGMAPALVLNSVLLWYPFAVLTHEGYSTGSAESRSHNYYGRFLYWFSLGLSLHRVHHLRPELSWIELRAYVEDAPGGRALAFRRDVRPDRASDSSSSDGDCQTLAPGSHPVGAG